MADNGRRRKLFVTEDGLPARFFLHPSIHRPGQRRKLEADIEAYGGRVDSTDDRVDTVLVSATFNKQFLRLRYGVDDDQRKRKVHVERLSFVQHCIQQKRFEHRAPDIKGMGGQLGRKRATYFTESDDEHLQRYIARALPRKEAGGRMGNKVYQQLVELGDRFPASFAWARRHTFHAWRERYKKKRQIFDPAIERIANEEGNEPLWLEDRRMSKRRRRTRRRVEDEDSQGEVFSQEEEEEDQSLEDQEEKREISPQSEEEEDQLLEDEEEEWETFPPSKDENAWDGEDEDEGWQAQDEHLDPMETKKRKRTRHPSGQLAKKRRIGQNVSPSYPARSKGKEKAQESDEEPSDKEIFNTSLFSIDEAEIHSDGFENDVPGPSNVVRSPDRTLAEPHSRSSHKQINSTQETLVNTLSRLEFEPVSHSTSAHRRRSGNTSRSQPISRIMEEEQHEQEEQPMLNPPTLRPPSPRIAQSPPKQTMASGTSRGGQHAPTETKQRAARGPNPHPTQRAPLTVIQSNDAPYRNTRARSRSVEPIAMPPPRPKATRKRKQNSEVVEPDFRKEGPIPATETIEEEMDVEDILMKQTSNDGAAARARARAPSLETDDAQTKQDLRAASAMFERKSFVSTRIQASDALRKYTELSSSSKRYSLPQNDLALDENRRREAWVASGLGAFKVPEPRTPANVSRRREEYSTSSDDPFPIKGTRASAKKKKMQEQAKYNPYDPPEGTRAAQLARSR